MDSYFDPYIPIITPAMVGSYWKGRIWKPPILESPDPNSITISVFCKCNIQSEARTAVLCKKGNIYLDTMYMNRLN